MWELEGIKQKRIQMLRDLFNFLQYLISNFNV